MSFDKAIWFMLGYIAIYYFLARHVLGLIIKIDSSYVDFDTEKGRLPIDVRTSLAITEMIFDSDLPGSIAGVARVGLYAVRIMLACSVPLFVGLLLI